MKIVLANLRNTLGIIGPDTVDNIARGLQDQGMEVLLLTSKSPIQPLYPKIHYSTLSLDGSYKNLLICLIHFIKKTRLISKKTDILQLYLPNPAFAFLGDIIAFKNKVPIIVVYESSLLDCKQIMPYIKNSFFFYFSRIIFNNRLIAKLSKFTCRKYVISSQYQKEQLIHLGYLKEKLEVIPNSIDTKKYNRFNKQEVRKKFGFSKDLIIITYLGHLTHNKGVDLLIKSFPVVLRKIPNVRLVLAWSELASGEKKIKKLIKEEILEDKVIILGEVDVPDFFSATDILVLPYRVTFATQLFPSTLLEAMSVGVPLVTTNIEPLSELFKDKKAALLVSPADSIKIAEAIINLLGDKKLRKEMINSQKEIIQRKFSQEIIINKYLKLYKELKNE